MPTDPNATGCTDPCIACMTDESHDPAQQAPGPVRNPQTSRAPATDGPSAPADHAVRLTGPERQFLTYAIQLVAAQMASGRYQFDDADHASLAKFRRMAAQAQQTEPAQMILTDSQYDRAWHAVEGEAGREGSDPGTILNAALDALHIDVAKLHTADRVLDERMAAAKSQAVEPKPLLNAGVCGGFPEHCPNILTVEPDPPTHYGGIRCGCADDKQQAAPAVDTTWSIKTSLDGATWQPYAANYTDRSGALDSYQTAIDAVPDHLRFRLIRVDTTHTIEAEHTPQQPGEGR